MGSQIVCEFMNAFLFECDRKTICYTFNQTVK